MDRSIIDVRTAEIDCAAATATTDPMDAAAAGKLKLRHTGEAGGSTTGRRSGPGPPHAISSWSIWREATASAMPLLRGLDDSDCAEHHGLYGLG